MTIRKVCVAAFVGVLLSPRFLFGACPVERGPVKTGTDAEAAQVSLLPIPAEIVSLHSIPTAPRPLFHDRRIAPVETTVYSVTATLVAYRLTPQSEIQLVLSDEDRRTIVATIPSPDCAAGSPFLSGITAARSAFSRSYVATEVFTEVRRGVQVQGVGFFDFLQRQRGLSPNGLSLYPVTAINLRPFPPPKAPPPSGRRRAVGSGARSCPRPSLVLSASRGSVCSGEQLTIDWRASDADAKVDIPGIGLLLPATGSRVVPFASSAVYSGRAINACGAGNEALTVVTLTPAATASLTGPSAVTSGHSATLSVVVSGTSSWSLTSSLGNTIAPSFGTSSRTVAYSAARTGTDTVTLTTAGGACGNLTRAHIITVGSPPNLGLRCCDGTRSPTCFDCNNKQGCCSGHQGVCGC